MGRPKSGQAYECYKDARRNYKKACCDASNAAIRGGYANTSQLLKCNKISDFWRVVNQAKPGEKHECKVAIDNLEEYYEDKFTEGGNKTEKTIKCENVVSEKSSKLDNVDFSYAMMTEMDMVKCVKLLACGKAPGVDGLAAEHYIHGLESLLPLHISSVLTLCLRHGLVPDTFLHGVLIPLYKTGKASHLASSNRPVTLSVTLSKVLELHILHMCQQHQPHPAQFGFASDRGTDMAIALAHDVSEYFNRRGSPVFTCCLDAQGTFDHIPHSVIFAKLDGVLPDHVWRLLYRWYSSMYVTVRLHGSLGRRLRVKRGVRQGSITSPWLFNLEYQELVQHINAMDCGIGIGNKCFNIICYADDLLLASATITGLQAMVDACTDYVESHGLNFNVSKTSWTIIGKAPFASEPAVMLSGTVLSMENRFKYLMADLGSKGSSTHVAQRIKAANGAFYKLQAAGVQAVDSVPKQYDTYIRSLSNRL